MVVPGPRGGGTGWRRGAKVRSHGGGFAHMGPLGFFLFSLETTGAGSTWDLCDPGLLTAPASDSWRFIGQGWGRPCPLSSELVA